MTSGYHGQQFRRSVARGVTRFRVDPDLADSDGLSIVGHPAVFNDPTEIGGPGPAFVETIRPGAFRRTLTDRPPAGVLMQFAHGLDPAVGTVPLGEWVELREDAIGLFARGRLFATVDTDRLRAALHAGLLGASFRFRVPEDGATWNRDRTKVDLHHVDLLEAGPCLWGAYPAAALAARQPPGQRAGRRPAADEAARRRRILQLRGITARRG